MNPTLETIKKGQETFDSHMSATFLIADEKIVQSVLDRMKQWHTSFLISLFEVEVERLSSEMKEEYMIDDCENCGGVGYGKAWYGKGKPNDPHGFGDAYHPTGSVVYCKECSQSFTIGKWWADEEIWKRTSDDVEYTNQRLNQIRNKVPENVGYNESHQDQIKHYQEIIDYLKSIV